MAWHPSLQPGSSIPRRCPCCRGVRTGTSVDFLTLYWDELPFVRYEDLPRRMEVARVILVDTQTLITPRGMSDETTVQIIDHHPLSRDLPPTWTYSGEEVGATTTLLVEAIIGSGLPLTPIEATLLALGIYEDTGSLLYPTTTPRDLQCATWLVRNGANLSVVSDYLHHPLTEQQLALYDELLANVELLDFSGHTVVISTARAEGPVEEISALAHKIRDLYDPAGLFLIVDLGEHLQVVARSTTERRGCRSHCPALWRRWAYASGCRSDPRVRSGDSAAGRCGAPGTAHPPQPDGGADHVLRPSHPLPHDDGGRGRRGDAQVRVRGLSRRRRGRPDCWHSLPAGDRSGPAAAPGRYAGHTLYDQGGDSRRPGDSVERCSRS
jgi:hypothetical protein